MILVGFFHFPFLQSELEFQKIYFLVYVNSVSTIVRVRITVGSKFFHAPYFSLSEFDVFLNW